MKPVAVIRRTSDDHAFLVDAARAAFTEVIDVHRWEQVRVEHVDSSGQVTARLGGQPLDALRSVLFLGAPGVAEPQPTRDQLYVQAEREQSLLAALAAARTLHVFNCGAVFVWNRLLFEPSAQMRTLARLGWATPSQTRSLALDGDAAEAVRLREPEPARTQLTALAIGLRRHALVRGPAPAGLAELVARTQLHLREQRLDLVTVPVALTDDGPLALGIQLGLTVEVPRATQIQLLAEALA